MTFKPVKVKDGASLRRVRVMAMLDFIDAKGEEGCETIDVQSYMLQAFGLKFETTAHYLHECSVAGFVRYTTDGWRITARYKRAPMV